VTVLRRGVGEVRVQRERQRKRESQQVYGRISVILESSASKSDRLYGLVEFLATDPEIPGSIPSAVRFSEE
jgi:hypothetical protein